MTNHLNNNENNNMRIIAFGLDAVDPDLVDRWSKEGYLPVISSLRESGSWGKLMSNTEISSGTTWASLNTGNSAAKHGMGFYHRQLKTGSYEIVKKYADQVGRNPFWKILGEMGKRILVFDIPVTYPIESARGIQIIGWGEEGLNWEQSSLPPEIMNEIFLKFGKHPLDGWYQKVVKSVKEWKELKGKLIEGVKTRTTIAKWLLEKELSDFALIGFAEPHWAGHYFWHLMDETNPRFDPDAAKECGTTLLEVYMEVDRSIGQLLDCCPNYTTFIFSNTGIGPNYSGQHLIPEILKRLGMTDNRPHNKGNNVFRKVLPAHRWGPYTVKKVEKIVSADIIEKVKKIIPSKLWDKWTRRFLTVGNNWKTSKTFTVPADFTGAIRINLKGREPNGLVEISEYDSICEELIRECKSLINPLTGQNAVTEVIKVRDKYKGEFIDDLPDLIVKWEGSSPITSLTSERIGTVSGSLPDNRSGAHKTYGLLIAKGERIKNVHDFKDGNIEDIAPTILYLFGAAIPDDIDGKILIEVITEDFQIENPIKMINGKV
jgi:predicted AlkP superfamily phosphohydrolase/phosphomutase